MTINPLLPELIALQNRDHFLRDDELRRLSEKLGVPLGAIYSVASFYQAFRFKPAGRHSIKVCVGAACYVKGAETVYQAFADHLQLSGDTDTTSDGLWTLGRVACLGCCMLAVAVEIDRHIYGHVTGDRVSEVLRDFLETVSRESDEESDENNVTESAAEIRICRCSSCRAAGSGEIFRAFEREKKCRGFDYRVREVGCHGMSYRAPTAVVVTGGRFYHYDRVEPQDVGAILAHHFVPTEAIKRVVWKGRVFLERLYRREEPHAAESETPDVDQIAEASRSLRLVTEKSGQFSPESLDDYRAGGGMIAFQKARNLSPEQVVEQLKKAKLRGRGGGGFLTGEKWRLALEAPGEEKVVLCNADEGDPGAFMDRMLLESYPFRVLEGMLIAARVLGAKSAIIYIRDEYARAVAVLERVIEQLKRTDEYRSLGPDFDMAIFKGAGAFVCGEETAMIESIEGKRGIPRRRPPFPVTCGLNGRPTLNNNVETFACVPMILRDGGELFRSVGTNRSPGTKAFALAGKVRRGGLLEVPIGMTVGELVEKYGGGAEEGHEIKAVMIGGPSGGVIPKRLFDLPIDYEILQKNGAMMGSGGLIVLDERDCVVDLSLYFLRFLQSESCGKCLPCREGIGRLAELVQQLQAPGEKEPGLLREIESLACFIRQGALCALGRTAPNMILSALHAFPEEFTAHRLGYCPAGKCVELTEYRVCEACIGCTKCAQACPAGAMMVVALRRAVIDPVRCVRCGVCRSVCPRGAVIPVPFEFFRGPGQKDPQFPKVTEGGSEKSPWNRYENIQEKVESEEARPFLAPKPEQVERDFFRMDGQTFPFVPDRTLLSLAEENGWNIPTLCHLPGKEVGAHCLVCALWDATLGRFVLACEQTVQRGHVYESQGERVRVFRRTALELALRRHDFRCVRCAARTDCRFLTLIREYGAKKIRWKGVFPEKIDARFLSFDAGKCLLCHRCLAVSEGILTPRGRGDKTRITPEPETWDALSPELAATLCDICPTGALTKRTAP